MNLNGKNNLVVLGGDENELFEKTIRKGVHSAYKKVSGQLNHLITIDLAPFVPYGRNTYKVSMDLINILLKSFEGNTVGTVCIPGTIMPVADSEIISSVFDSLMDKNIPAVSIGTDHHSVPSIFADDTHGITSMMDHLIDDHGYKHIAYVSGPESYDDAAKRNRAYRDTVKRRGLKAYEADGDFSMEGGIQAVQYFSSLGYLDTLDAIACADDDTASGVIRALKDRGIRVPEDIAVVGFDNSEHAQKLGITSVDPQLESQGETAVDILLGNNAFRNVKTHIDRKRSCGCLPVEYKQTVLPDFNQSPTEASREVKGGIFNFGKKEKNSSCEEVKTLNVTYEEILPLLEIKLNNREMASVVARYITSEEKDPAPHLQSLFSLMEACDDLDILCRNIKAGLDALLSDTPLRNNSDSLSRIINLYQNYPVLINKIRDLNNAQVDIQMGHLSDTLTDLKSEMVSANTLEELIMAVETSAEELEIKDLSVMLFKSEKFSFSTDIKNEFVIYLQLVNGRILKSPDKSVDGVSFLKNLYTDYPGEKISIVPLYSDKNFGFLTFGDCDSSVIQSFQESVSQALDNIRNRELKSESNVRITLNRDKLVDRVEPLINMAHKLAMFVKKEKSVLIGNLTKSSNTSIDTINESNKAIETVNKQIQHIVELIKSIDNITEKTEVLSINASIEAARAGEHGRGFKVIANGIKKLSEAQNAESEMVNTHIKEAEEAMANTILFGSNNLNAISEVKAQILNAIDFFKEIENNLEGIINLANSTVDEIRTQQQETKNKQEVTERVPVTL